MKGKSILGKGQIMDIKRIWSVYFSPAGSTKHVTLAVAGQIAEKLEKEICEIEYTKLEQRKKTYYFGRDDLLVFGMPVYAGRIPNKILPDIEKGFCAEGAALIPIVVYGSRSFDDALIELKMLLEKRGFLPLAAAAVVSRHVFSDFLASGRPDQDDMRELYEFAGKAALKIRENEVLSDLAVMGNYPPGNYYTPLKEDGTPAKFLKAKPITDKSRCTGCGICAEVCPMGSVDAGDYSLVAGICIKCHACIRKCPAHAKAFVDEQFLSHVKMLEKNYGRRARNYFFY